MTDPNVTHHDTVRAQARLLRRAKKKMHAWRMIVLRRFHYRYVWDFLSAHRALLFGLGALFVTQMIVEVSLIMIGRHYISFDVQSVVSQYFVWVVIILVGIFLTLSFFVLKYERSLVVFFANQIRKRLFSSYLCRRTSSSHARARLIAQISYHVPLVSLGVSHVFFGTLRVVLYGVMVTMLAYLGGFSVWIFSISYLILCTGVSMLAYLFSRYWTSQEVTYYSRIMRGIEVDASDTDFIAMFGQKDRVLAAFDRLVEFDSFFRIRRDVFMRIGYAVVFVLVLVCSMVMYTYPELLVSFIDSPYAGERLFLIFLLIYISRAVAQAYTAGLYLFPARLGLFLTLRPLGMSPRRSMRILLSGTSIRFHAHKIRLCSEGPYYRRMDFLFHPGDRILIQGDNLSGKTSLARLCAGVSAHIPRALTVSVGATRLSFVQWQAQVPSGVYFFDPSIRTERSLIEYIMGKVKEDISLDMFASAVEAMNQYPALTALVAPQGNYNASAQDVLSNPIHACALHILHCIVSKPVFIIIDNFWIDLNYPLIRDMIRILDQVTPSSIVLACSRLPNDYFSYTQHYVLSKTITRVT